MEITFSDVYFTYYTAAKLARDDITEAQAKEAEQRLSHEYQALRESLGYLHDGWCQSTMGAVWLGDKPLQLYARLDSEAAPPDLDDLMDRAMALGDKAVSLLEAEPRSLRRVLEEIYATITRILFAADAYAEEKPAAILARRTASAQVALESDVNLLNALTQRRAQFQYFRGMVFGGAALIASATVLAIVAPVFPRTDDFAVDSIAGCILGGSLGATFSVLSRMHSGRLQLTADAGDQTLRLLGGVRPVVGAVAGIALFLLIDGEVLDILNKPEPSARAWSYFAGLSFLAGFSERWFQDMLAVNREDAAGRQGTPSDSVAPPNSTQPGQVPPPSGIRSNESSGTLRGSAAETKRPPG